MGGERLDRVSPHEVVHVSTLSNVAAIPRTPRVGGDAGADVVRRLEIALSDGLGSSNLRPSPTCAATEDTDERVRRGEGGLDERRSNGECRRG